MISKVRALAGIMTVLFLVSMVPVNAITTTDLIADGRDNPTDVGDITVWVDSGNLYVKYTITTGGLYLIELHLAVDKHLLDIPQNNKHNPKVGQFPYQEPWGPPAYGSQTPWEWTFEIALTSIDGGAVAGDMLYIAAQAEVGVWGDPGDLSWVVLSSETAWGYGPSFGGANWAMYFTFVVPA